MQIIHHLTMDMVRQLPMTPVGAVQNDANTRAVEMHLLENGTPWVIPQGITAAVAFRKSDGSRGLYDRLPDGAAAITTSGSTVTAILAPQVLTCPGTVSAAIVFFDGGLNRLAAFPFAIRVERDPSAGQGISNDYYRFSTMEQVSAALEDFLAKAEEALQEVHDAATADAPAIVCETTGEIITVADASDRVLQGLSILGKTTQNGTPTPTSPVPLESAGASGSIGVTVAGKNLIDLDDLKWIGDMPTSESVTMLETGIRMINLKQDGTYRVKRFSLGAIENYIGKQLTFKCDMLAAGRANCAVLIHVLDKSNTTVERIKFVENNNPYTFTIQNKEEYQGCVLAIGLYSTYTNAADVGDYSEYTNIQLEFGDTATAYEKGKPWQTLTASTEGGLHGIGDVCDEIDFARGVRVQRTKRVTFDSSSQFKQYTSLNQFYIALGDIKKVPDQYTKVHALCSAYVANSYSGSATGNMFVSANDESGRLRFSNSNYTTVEDFAASMVGQTVVYALETPIETPLSAQELAQYAALHSHKPNTTAFNDGDADMAIAYVADTKTYIDQKLAAISAAILNC